MTTVQPFEIVTLSREWYEEMVAFIGPSCMTYMMRMTESIPGILDVKPIDIETDLSV